MIKVILESPEGKELLSVNDQYDNLPIHVAAKMGNVDCVQLLLDVSKATAFGMQSRNTFWSG